MRFEAVYRCSVALLRGLELQAGFTRVRLRPGRRDAYDEAAFFVNSVGEGRALRAALLAMEPKAEKKTKKGRVRWI